jgi:hypothetical protein
MRRSSMLAALAIPGLLSLGSGAPAALAADDCPNAAVRAQQQSQHLPGCMAYEKVTPDDKGGELAGPTMVRADGNGLLFTLNAGIEDAQSFTSARYRAMRSPDGRWTTNALMPAMDGPRLPSLHDGIDHPLAWTPDLSRVVIDTAYPIYPNDQGISNPGSNIGTDDIFIREPNGSFTWLAPDPSAGDSSTLHVAFVGASPDLERVVLTTARRWDPRVTGTNVQHAYVWTRNGTQLASVLPNGDVATSVGPAKRASADGRRVAFSVGSRAYVRFDADDPASAFTREVAVGPNGEVCAVPAGSGNTALRSLSPDGTKLTFFCAASTAPGTLPEGSYLRDLDAGPAAVRAIPSADWVHATDDLTVGYGFEGGIHDERVVRYDGDQTETVATTVAPGTNPLGGNGFDEVRSMMSTDGEYFTFSTGNDLGLPGVDKGTLLQEQVYLYAAATGTLTCVSCRQDGRPTEGFGELRASTKVTGGGGGGSIASVDAVSTRGTVTFTSTTALVPEDTNGRADAYAWVDGRAVLLSSGRGQQFSVAQGSTPDGSSFFFATADALVGDDHDGGAYDLYAARVNGGVLLPEPPVPPCTANCQAPTPPVPGLPPVGSSTFFGRGNAVVAEQEAAEPATKATAKLSASRSVRGSRATVRVRVSRPGRIRVSGVGLRRVTKTAKKAGTYEIKVRLSKHGVRKQRRSGRLAVRVSVRLTPESGSTVTARRTVRFTAARKGGR